MHRLPALPAPLPRVPCRQSRPEAALMAALRPAPLGRASPRVVAVAVASRGGPTRLRAARGRRQRPTPAAQADAIVAPRTRSNQTGPAVHGRRYHPAGERPVGLLEAQPLSRYCSWAIGDAVPPPRPFVPQHSPIRPHNPLHPEHTGAMWRRRPGALSAGGAGRRVAVGGAQVGGWRWHAFCISTR